MADFSIWKALLIVFFYIVIDWLYAVYTIYIVDKKTIKACNAGSLIYAINAFGVMVYISSPIYVIFVTIGAWIGTYLGMKIHADKKID